ncbi:MAG: hypothetical protein NT007_13765 [Candidatus Kapabacteria bacterium]|nr:hypothetical protein [Candidatus Kapabacteria bacterium]
MNQQLIEEINIDLSSMEIIASDVETLLTEVADSTPNNIHKTALGGLAAQFYNGIENIIKRIHKNYNIPLPKGDDWHISILERFSNESEIDFPIKFSNDLLEKLTNYRRFRHYFFQGYSHNLNWEILTNGVKDIKEVLEQFKQELVEKE